MAGNLKPEYNQIKHLLSSTVTLLCKNGVPFANKIHVEALVGVTVDDNDVFFVHISETIPNDTSGSQDASQVTRVRSEPQYPKMPHQLGQGRRSGPASRTMPQPHSPASLPGSPRSGSPAGMKQHRNGIMGLQQQHQIQQQQRHFPMVSRQSPQLKRSSFEDDSVVIVKQERMRTPDSTGKLDRMRTPDSVSHQASMVGVQQRTPFVTSNVKVIEPLTDPSLDDAEAMQKSYSVKSVRNITPTNTSANHSDLASEPTPPKRQCIDNGSNSDNSFMSDQPQIDTSVVRPISGPWTMRDVSSHSVNYSDQMSHNVQAFPTSSNWTPGKSPVMSPATEMAIRNQYQRGFKNPRNNTMCQPVRDVLEFSLAQPILADAHEISAFRIFWRGHDTIAGWRNIIYNRLELDAIVAEYPGVSFFISAITATARDPKTIVPSPGDPRLRAYPALGYWIVSRDSSFDRHVLMKKLADAAEGGELKTMLQNDGEKVNEVGALNLIVKDYGKGYVQQRVAESALISCGPDEEHPTIRFILKEDFFEEKLREGVDLLSGVGCPVSLEKVDMDTAATEDGEEQDAEQKGTSDESETSDDKPKKLGQIVKKEVVEEQKEGEEEDDLQEQIRETMGLISGVSGSAPQEKILGTLTTTGSENRDSEQEKDKDNPEDKSSDKYRESEENLKKKIKLESVEEEKEAGSAGSEPESQEEEEEEEGEEEEEKEEEEEERVETGNESASQAKETESSLPTESM